MGRRPEVAGPTREAESSPTCRRSTSGTATTTTATATSTSRTATSTTSRSCTPAATRPTAIRGRARTPSGRTAGTRSRRSEQDPTGPTPTSSAAPEIGDTGIWIGDYTIQPENGGRSVFFHEYGHDLGLPDDYDTAGGGDNANEWWTLMAQSRLGAKGEQFIGDRAGDLGAWNKLQLGWLDYEIGGRRPDQDAATRSGGVQLIAAAGAGRRAAEEGRDHRISAHRSPASNQWWSGQGDDSGQHDDPAGDPAGRHRGDAHLPRPGTTSRTAAPTCRLRLCRGRRRHRLTGRLPATITDPDEGNGIDRRHRRLGADATFDLSRVRRARRSGSASGTSPTAPLRATDPEQDRPASSSTTSPSPPTARRCSPTAPRPAPNGWTADGLQHRRRHVRPSRLRQLLHRRLADLHVLRQVPQDRSVQLRLSEHASRTGSSTSRTSRVC